MTDPQFTMLLIPVVVFLWAAIGVVAILCLVSSAVLRRRRGEDSEAAHFAAVAEITREYPDWDTRELTQ